MKNNRLSFRCSLIISSLLHFLILASFRGEMFTPVERKDTPSEAVINDSKVKITLYSKNQSSSPKPTKKGVRAKSRRREKNDDHLGISFSKLGVDKVNSEMGKVGNVSFSRQFNLYQHINQYLHYPSLLSQNNVEGHVHVKVTFNKNGLKRMSIKTHHPLLRVFVASLLERALNPSHLSRHYKEKLAQAKMVFHFELTTDMNKEKTKIDKLLYFYRRKYGGETGVEKVAQGTATTLAYLSNILLLYQHRPDFMRSDKELTERILKEQAQLKIKDHPFFNREVLQYD